MPPTALHPTPFGRRTMERRRYPGKQTAAAPGFPRLGLAAERVRMRCGTCGLCITVTKLACIHPSQWDSGLRIDRLVVRISRAWVDLVANSMGVL